jgi:phosphoribosylglycinamide formyltransferase-1
MVIDREMFYHSNEVVNKLLLEKIDLIVLAGFLWLVPMSLIRAFQGRIINIHPALLPKYGGKGMYGMNVHRAVFDNKEEESGMSVHYVSEKYDEGGIIFQSSCDISGISSPEDIANEVLKLEHKYYPVVIESLLTRQDEEL